MAFSTGANMMNLGLGGASGYLSGGWPGAAQGVVGAGLGQIPVVGGMASGAFGGAMSPNTPQPQMNPAMTQGLTRAGMRPDEAPDTKRGGLLGNTKTAKIARGVGAGALSLIPGVGPVAGAGLMAAGQMANAAVDKRNAQATGRQVGQWAGRMTSMANRAKMGQAAQGQGARLAKLAGGAAGGGQRIKAGLGAGGMGQGGMTVAGVTGGPGGNATNPFTGTPLSRSQTRALYGGNTQRRTRGNRDVASASTAAPGTEPYGTAQGYRRSMRNARGKKGLARQSDEILAQQMREGLDPRILSGLNQGAIQAAQGTRQTMADALARTGDSSGYEAAMRGGMDMALQNQLAQIYPEWLQKRQDYINDLVFKWRGTRRGAVSPTPSPSGGTDWGSILQGVGALGNTAANMYGTFRPQANNAQSVAQQTYWNTGNVGPAQVP